MPDLRKSQSAMEYLMTYGWAILAIAIVMVSLYSLGIFNTGNLQPTATPGSCEVVRTTAQTSLAGQCNNLIPKYVGQFNGANSYASTGTKNLPTGSGARSVTAWIYYTGTGSPNPYDIFTYGTASSYEFASVFVDANALYFDGFNDMGGGGLSVSMNKWYFIAYTYSATGTQVTLYQNGQSQTASITALNTVLGTSYIGADIRNAFYFQGYMSNIQVYNTSLDSSSIQAVYQEGIGGAPIDVRHLVAWWPLNGNANDYSGNNNQGTPSDITWNANWQSGYTAPTS